MIPQWFTELALVTGFIASIAICILLVIEANVLIRLLPLIKQSALNSSAIVNKIDQGEGMVKGIMQNKIQIPSEIRNFGVVRRYANLQGCISPDDPHHIHENICFSS